MPEVGRYSRADPLGVVDVAGFSPWNRVSSFTLRQRYSYAKANPLARFDPLGLDVKVCSRPVDLPVLGRLGIPHKWVKTDTKEAGLGPAGGGVPGEVAPACDNSCPYIAKTEITNHSGQSSDPNASCETIANVDEGCVNRLLEVGQAQGPWAFGFNDCWTFADRVILACRTGLPSIGPSPPEFYGPTPFR